MAYLATSDSREVDEKVPFLSERYDDLEYGPMDITKSRLSHYLRYTLHFILMISIGANLFFVSSHQPSLSFFSNDNWQVELYSPAESLTRTPTLRKFNPAFGVGGSEAIYRQRPSPEVDKAWKALYYPTQIISAEEARLLPNRTVPVSAEPGAGYLVGLSVFHDLHCLDSIRKALWFRSGTGSSRSHHDKQSRGDVHQTYEDEHHDVKHLMHCIDNLRQSLMCHADTTSVSWQWSQAEQGLRVFSDVTHQCRDFDSTLQWGRENAWRGTIEVQHWTDGRPPELGKCGAADEGCGWK